MSEQPTPLKRMIFPLIALVPLMAATIWVITAEEQTASPAINPAPESSPVTVESSPASSPPIQPEEPKDGIAHETPSSLGEKPFASSLEGTEIDGSLRAGPDGNLIVDLSTKDFFDYFLNTVGEVSPETALARIETLARDHLPSAAAEQAMAVLAQYLDYKRRAVELGNRGLDPALAQDPAYQLQMLKTALSDLKQLRRNAFDAEVHQAFFGLQEAYGDYTLASIEIQQRTDLSPESKKTLVEWHRNQLPEQLRETENRMISDAEQSRQRQQAIEQAGSPSEAGERLRALGVEPQQAQEVVRYLQEREQFDQQFQQYRQALASLENAGISEGDFDTQQHQLLQQHFDSEQARTWAKLKSLDTGQR